MSNLGSNKFCFFLVIKVQCGELTSVQMDVFCILLVRTDLFECGRKVTILFLSKKKESVHLKLKLILQQKMTDQLS